MTKAAKHPRPADPKPAPPKRTIEELRAWAAANPFPTDPTPAQAADWHMAAIEFEFGKGSYVWVENKEPPKGFAPGRAP